MFVWNCLAIPNSNPGHPSSGSSPSLTRVQVRIHVSPCVCLARIGKASQDPFRHWIASNSASSKLSPLRPREFPAKVCPFRPSPGYTPGPSGSRSTSEPKAIPCAVRLVKPRKPLRGAVQVPSLTDHPASLVAEVAKTPTPTTPILHPLETCCSQFSSTCLVLDCHWMLLCSNWTLFWPSDSLLQPSVVHPKSQFL